jgi:F0F1-type ATP synthase assembly protein I
VLPRRGKQTDLWAQIAFYTSLGFILPAGAVGGYVLGWLLDDWLHTKPILGVVLAMLGAAGGFLEVLRILTRAERNAGGNNASGGPGAS